MASLVIGGLGVPELLIILAVLLLLFGGARLAGLGKSTGRALREFKEETKGLKGGDEVTPPSTPHSTTPPQATGPGPYTASSWTPPASVTPPEGPATDVRRDT